MDLLIGLIIIIIDQIIKSIISINLTYGTSIGKFIKITNISNTGIAYGIGQGRKVIIIIVNIIIIYLLLKFLIKNYKNLTNIVKFSLVIIISGGLSNLVDRIFRGYVVDYIDISKVIKYPVFNIADISIVVGVFLLVVYIIVNTIKKQESK